MDMSLDQIIKNQKSNTKQSGSRARRSSFGTKSGSSSSSRRDSGVKFTARLDIDKPRRARAPRAPRAPKISATSTPTTTTSKSLAAPPPLKITIQNNAKPKSPVLSSRREERADSDRIRVSKSNIQRRPPQLSRVRSIGNSNSNNSYYSNNNNNSSSQYSYNDPSIRFGDGPSLFERKSHLSSFRGNQPTGKNLQLFTGSRLDLSNLHHGITVNDLRTLFEKMGEIKTVKINYDRSGRSEGTGYVVYSKDSDAKLAIDRYNGATLDGYNLVITKGHSLQDAVRDLY